MIALAFHYEEYNHSVYSGNPTELQIWRETVKAFGADHMILIDLHPQKTGRNYSNPDSDMGYARFDSLDEAVAGTNATWVYLEDPRTLSSRSVPDATMLKDFVHPADPVVYCVGPDSRGFTVIHQDPRKFVSIETTWTPGPNGRPRTSWSLGAAAIVLYDRLIKAG